MNKAQIHPLRVARCQHNLTTARLADEAKVGASTIWRAEHNYVINAESRRRLCAYFGKSSHELGLLHPDLSSPQMDHETSIEIQSNKPAQTALTELATDQLDRYLRAQEPSGPWLIFEAQKLSSLFDEQWNLNAILEPLRIILQGMQNMPASIRKNVLQLETQLTTRCISDEERQQLTVALDTSIQQSWQIFHTSSPRQVIVLGQALLHLVQQTYVFLDPTICPGFFSTIYNLIGAGFYFQNDYVAAQQAHTRAFNVAYAGHDLWNQAQSLNWYSIVANAGGKHLEAIHHLETALGCIEQRNDCEYLRLKAHLLANWAYNASIMGDQGTMQHKLEASVAFLEHLEPNEEFDLVRWHQMAGECMLINHQYAQAIHHLEQALTQLPPKWLERRILTLIPLAKAYAHQQERDASITIAREAASVIHAVASSLLQKRFSEYLFILKNEFPGDRCVREFISSAFASL
ncbi:helix-turn-helix domain-containing protein [Tengunoibacter tsumagoiensis]|uniref:HTH cro/C1-type domain-containing protein n=1 Tax=Tengunoibacter tsumagoiensis TaxID=2014871 RepID=A0A402A740_9CHLR|nr:helix-turn-helix transcriptional regulator [Tengunoibacter tsumagoiensis]GCE14846.1 hypothetical protein KTT_47050 [Tengunoibacter tsumagoiensis]